MCPKLPFTIARESARKDVNYNLPLVFGVPVSIDCLLLHILLQIALIGRYNSPQA